jgi:hypothetical protein
MTRRGAAARTVALPHPQVKCGLHAATRKTNLISTEGLIECRCESARVPTIATRSDERDNAPGAQTEQRAAAAGRAARESIRVGRMLVHGSVV